MRLFPRSNTLLLLLLALGACKWGEFDDLADTTWVHATDKPNIGSTNYAMAIVGVTAPTQSSGGQIAVVSNDVPNYSTLDYTADGQADVGPNNQKLGVHFIASLSDPPILISDGAGKVALVERAIDAGNIAVVTGPANAVADTPFASPNTPDAATFAGSSLIVAAGPTFYTLGGMGVPPACTSTDSSFRAAALASDGTNVFVWTTGGVLGSVPAAALSPCTGGMLPSFGSTFTSTGLMPGPGSQLHLLLAKYAVLVGHPQSSNASQIIVVDTTTMMQVGTTISLSDGIKSSTTGGYGGAVYVAVGMPQRSVDGKTSGQVELYEMAPSTGVLTTSPALVLNDAQPEGDEQFGRALTTMKFNGQEILVVGANSEVFAYYKTALYDALPAQ